MIIFNSEHLQIIRNHAESTYPEECCGIIFGHFNHDGKIVVEILSTDNVWGTQAAADFPNNEAVDQRKHRYAIAPQVMLQAQKQARERSIDIIGIYHSHPDYPAMPSKFDHDYAWQGYSYIIVSVSMGKAGDLNSWCLDNDHQFQQEEIKIQKF